MKKTWLIARLTSCEWNVQDGEEFKRGLYEKTSFWKTAFSPTLCRKVSKIQNFWTKNSPRLHTYISVLWVLSLFRLSWSRLRFHTMFACCDWMFTVSYSIPRGIPGSFLIRSFHRCLGRPISHIFRLVFSEKFWQLSIDPPLSKHVRLDLSFGVSLRLISYPVR